MNVDQSPVVTVDVETQTALYLRSVLPGGTDVRADLSGWDGTTSVLHVHRVGGVRDRFTDRARVAVDAHAPTRDLAWALANAARAWLIAMPAKRRNARTSEELGPIYLPTIGELSTIAMTWLISI